MSVRAKMKCDGVTLSGSADGGGSVSLSPVTNGSPENANVYRVAGEKL
jgi:hypothetical protein